MRNWILFSIAAVLVTDFAFPGSVEKFEIQDLSIVTDNKLAFSHSVQPTIMTAKDGSKVNLVGKWLIVHEHVSIPVGEPSSLQPHATEIPHGAALDFGHPYCSVVEGHELPHHEHSMLLLLHPQRS